MFYLLLGFDHHRQPSSGTECSIETITTRRFTRETRKCLTNVEHKSAITDPADRHNCVIDWDGVKVVDKETNRCARWIKEAIWIRKTEPTVNREEGATDLVTCGTVCSPHHLPSSDQNLFGIIYCQLDEHFHEGVDIVVVIFQRKGHKRKWHL